MGLKYSDFLFQPLKNNKIKLKKEVKYKDITIPTNFTSDGATIPWIAKIFNITRYRMDYLPCAIIHDWLCDLEEYKKADEYFCECFKELYVNKRDAKIMYLAVRFWHKIRYNSVTEKILKVLR